MVTVLAETPPTIPVREPTVPTAVLDDCQVPPAELVRGMVSPTHTEPKPVIGAGVGFTVTIVVLKQPVGIM
jgi:hypothetical protein